MAAGDDRRVEIELVAKDFATQVFSKFGDTAVVEGKRVERSLGGVGKTTRKLVSSLGALTAGFVGFAAATAAVRKGTRDFLEFNRAITEVETILGSSGKSIAAVSDEVRDLSLALGENEALVARGFYQTLSAGITDAAEATEVLTVATELAIGGLSQTAVTVDAITTVLNGYGQSADQARQISDVLFKSVELGKTRIDELGSSLGSIVPLAAKLNISFEEISASVVQLTKSGVATSEAVTQVRSAMVALLKSGDDIDSLFRERLGTSFSVADIKARGLVAVLNDIVRATGGSEDQLVKLLGRVEAVSGVLGLTANEGRGVAEVLKQLEGAAGSTARALEVQLLAPFKQLEILSGGVRQGLAELGGALIAGAIGDFSGNLDEVQETALRIRESIEALAPAMEQAGGASTVFVTGLGQGAVFLGLIENRIRLVLSGFEELTDEEAEAQLELEASLFTLTAMQRETLGMTANAAEWRKRAAEAREQIEAISFGRIQAESVELLRSLDGMAGRAALVARNLEEGTPEALGFAARVAGEVEEGLRAAAVAGERLGTVLDPAKIRAIAIDLELDPDQLLEDLGLLDDEFTARATIIAERFASRIRVQLAKQDPAIFPIDGPDPTAIVERYARSAEGAFAKVVAAAREAGVEIEEAAFEPFLEQLGSGSFRDAFVAAVFDATSAVEGEGVDVAVTPVLSVEGIKAELERLSAEEAVLKIGVEIGDVPTISLLKNQADQAALAFQAMGVAGKLSAIQVASAVADVEERLRQQIEATNEGGAALARFAQFGLAIGAVEAAIAGVTAATEQQAAAAQAAGEATAASQERVAQLQLESLPYYDAQRQGIVEQARAWEAVARASLEATNPAQLELELAAIDRTVEARLGQVAVEEQLSAARLNQQVLGLEIQAGLASATEAEKAAIAAQTEELIRQAEALGLVGAELDRIKDAGAAAGAAVGTFGKGFKDASKAAADPEALGAKTFSTAIGLAGDFGAALAKGGDAMEAFKERAVTALLEIIFQALAARAILAFSPGGGGLSGLFGGGGGAAAEGGIIEGQRVGSGSPDQGMTSRLASHAPPLHRSVAAQAFEHGGIMGARGGEPGGSSVSIPTNRMDRLQFRAFAEGGVASSPTVGLFAERPGSSEAFVPLGPSRKIPVEFKGDGPAGGGSGGGGETSINLTVHSLDPRGAADVILQSMPLIQQELASSIASGRAGEMVQAVREVSR